jgi:outer membrane protein with beta-barrel domain
MKKILGLSFFLFVLSHYSCGQVNVTGMRLGYNSAQFVGNGVKGTENKNIPGAYIGGFYIKDLQKFDIQTELLLSSKGYKMNSIGDTYLSNVFLYLEMPVLLKKDLFKNEKTGLYFVAGPVFMLKVISINLVSEIEGVRNFDLALNIGFELLLNKVSFDLRFNQSFINFDKIEPSKYHQVISFGMSFHLKSKSK